MDGCQIAIGMQWLGSFSQASSYIEEERQPLLEFSTAKACIALLLFQFGHIGLTFFITLFKTSK